MDTIFYFDVEDSVSPPENGADDVVLWIAQVLDRHGMKGCFHIIGDKVRKMAERGRHDIFAALRRHDVSSHYNTGSVHPTTTVRISQADWDTGVAIAMEAEGPGFEQIERIAGKCSGLTRHGGSYSPQAVHAAGRCGRVYYGVPFHPPGCRAFWLAGTLCFSSTGLIFTDDNQGGPGYLEHLYHDTPAFDAALVKLQAFLPSVTSQWPYTALFGSHPHRMNATNYSCWNHYGGVNRQPPLPPPLRPDAERATIRANFERFVAFLAKRPDLHFQGLDDLQRVYGRVAASFERDEVQAYARQVLAGDDVPLHARFSPAELLLAMAQSLLGAEPRVRSVIGPRRVPAALPPTQATRTETLDLARQLLDHATQRQALPDTLNLQGKPVALPQALDLLAQAVVDGSRAVLQTGPRAAYPQVADTWRPAVQAMAIWRVFPPNMDMSTIADLTCAQAWSVKPALRF